MFNPKRQRAFRRNLIAYAFILPGLLGFVIYYLIPIFAGVGFSMTDYTGLSIKIFILSALIITKICFRIHIL